MNKRRWVIIVVSLLIVAAFLEYKGIIWHNSLFAMKYKVRGIDVSHYQGTIDWDRAMESASFEFAYVKATEGKDYKDEYFQDNWNNAKRKGLFVGAYHFFTTQSSGDEQADHFIATVPNDPGSLPPVIEIEIALNKNVPNIRQQLMILTNRLERYYHKKPILYVTYGTFNTYVARGFEGHEIWIRDIVKYPALKGKKDWTFWQYNNRGRIAGIHAYVDLNVFHGSREQFLQRFKTT